MNWSKRVVGSVDIKKEKCQRLTQVLLLKLVDVVAVKAG